MEMMNMAALSVAIGLAGLGNARAEDVAPQAACGPRERVIEALDARYGEVRQSGGLAQTGMVVEVFASENTGSWTIVVTDVTGQSCLLAAGEAYAEFGADGKPNV